MRDVNDFPSINVWEYFTKYSIYKRLSPSSVMVEYYYGKILSADWEAYLWSTTSPAFCLCVFVCLFDQARISNDTYESECQIVEYFFFHNMYLGNGQILQNLAKSFQVCMNHVSLDFPNTFSTQYILLFKSP